MRGLTYILISYRSSQNVNAMVFTRNVKNIRIRFDFNAYNYKTLFSVRTNLLSNVNT